MKNLNNAHSLSHGNMDVTTYVRLCNGLNDWAKLNPLTAKTQAQYAGRVRSGLGLKRDKVDNGYSMWDYTRVYAPTKWQNDDKVCVKRFNGSKGILHNR